MNAAAWESLHKATLELAKSSALKQRLTDAFARHLLDLPPADMPGDLRLDFESLKLCMTRVRPQHGECAVAATVRKMSIPEADACAARIVALLDGLHRYAQTAAPARVHGQTFTRAAGTGDTATMRVPTLINVNRA